MDVLTYESYNDLFHVTNLSFYKEIIIEVFNTKIWNNEDINGILKPAQTPVIIADLMDISVFKIALHKDLLIIYIIHPIIKKQLRNI